MMISAYLAVQIRSRNNQEIQDSMTMEMRRDLTQSQAMIVNSINHELTPSVGLQEAALRTRKTLTWLVPKVEVVGIRLRQRRVDSVGRKPRVVARASSEEWRKKSRQMMEARYPPRVRRAGSAQKTRITYEDDTC